jgi:hypothetical protein
MPYYAKIGRSRPPLSLDITDNSITINIMGRSERAKGFGAGHQTPLHTQLVALLGLTMCNQKNGQKFSIVSKGHLIQ